MVLLVALGSPATALAAGAPARSRTAAALTKNGIAMPRVGVKAVWKFRKVASTRGHPIPTHWELVSSTAHYGAQPATIEPIGTTGAALYWTGWYVWPDGKFVHQHGNRRYMWFERVGTWQYLVNGQCEATMFVRLRITLRPPKIVHGKTLRAKATTLASLNYGQYEPEIALPVAVRLRYLN